MGEFVVAYDGSEGSAKALNKAVALLKEEDRLVIVYVLPTHILSEFAAIDSDMSKERAQAIVKKALDELTARGINAIGVVREGDVGDEIIKMGSELKCELIVVGSKGLSKVGTFALGSIADKVARHANRPVLIVR